MNNDSILMNNLCCLLNAIPFDGRSVICDPRTHTDNVIDCLDHGEGCTELQIEYTSECTELCIYSSVVQTKERIALPMPTMLIPVLEQPKSMMLVCQSLLLTMVESTIIMHNGRLASNPFNIISLDASLNHPVSASTSIATPFAASANISAHHATVGNCDSVSSMSAATWEPAAVQVYEESKDLNSIALTLDTNRISKIGLDIIGTDNVVTSLAIEREACVISFITDEVPFLEYKDLCNDVWEAFPGLASLIDSIESALATMIAEDLKKDGNDGNLLDLDSYANHIHVPTLDECITPEVLIQLNCIVPKVLLQLHDSKTSSTTGISIHDLFFGQCGDAMLALHQSMGSKATLGCFAMSCPGWASNCTDVTILPFDQGPPEVTEACSFAFQILFSSLPFG